MRNRSKLKMPMRKVGGFAALLALTVLLRPSAAISANGSDIVQGFYDALLSTMKNGRTLGQRGRSRRCTQLSNGPSTSPRWYACRSSPSGPP